MAYQKGLLDSAGLVEVKTLNSQQITRLTDLIYNTNFKKPGFNLVDRGACYEPRNAFIFYNDQGEIFDVLDICFHCKESHSKSDRITVGTLCAQKYDLLRKFFIGLGIKTGTITD